MNHSFDIDIAQEVGVEAAIIYENVRFWIAKNVANQENARDGHTWVYNSRSAWCELLPYLGEKQIRNALERLLEAGYLARAQYSYGPMNRTYWYRLGERAKQVGPNGQTKVGPNGQTKTVIDTDNKQTVPPTPKGEPDGFEEVWKAKWSRGTAPNPRQPALKAYSAALKRGAKPEDILAGVKARIGVEKVDSPYAPQLVTWLNQERWKDGNGQAVMSASDIEEAKRRLEESERQHKEMMQRLTEERRKSLGLTS